MVASMKTDNAKTCMKNRGIDAKIENKPVGQAKQTIIHRQAGRLSYYRSFEYSGHKTSDNT